ncbi:MAG: 3'-phosphoesterase [Candidatus Buchananbacteria bacterium RBG_13_39_9]|uniref:3'-phosphoesterase n=1 Tax=Candidatus Buchananbacteria bacterium RBG_13_39_9 TaxID=1797531 RepID=A0A1G1XMH1_9BACT|nr:MAG: 3'-phosphoesterase [Candidatus Buchananbacteria bacterium RBG_13_39_9]
MSKYKAKRKFTKTTEPKPKVTKKSLSRFVVQEHHARNLHWDFRLEMESHINSREIVLKSWAVSKGVPVKFGEKRLAVAVEDHPVDYINFKGTIPKGEYGAGTVKIWDRGKFKLLRRTKKEIEFILKGKKAKGRYALVRTSFGKNSWLLIKLKEK